MEYTDLVCFAIFNENRISFFSWSNHYRYSMIEHQAVPDKSFTLPPSNLLYEYQFVWREIIAVERKFVLAFSADADAIAMVKLSCTLKPLILDLPGSSKTITYYVTSF